MQQQNPTNIPGSISLGENPAPLSSYAQALASSSTGPAPSDVQMLPEEPSSRKRDRGRVATAEEMEELYAAEQHVELAIIFDTSDGKKGAFGGLGQDARESTERTIHDIVTMTLPDKHIEQIRVDSINVFANPSYYIVALVSRDDYASTLGSQPEVHKMIDYHIYNAPGAQPAHQKRSDVAIVITTPDHVPNLTMFANRADKSMPAGGLHPGRSLSRSSCISKTPAKSAFKLPLPENGSSMTSSNMYVGPLTRLRGTGRRESFDVERGAGGGAGERTLEQAFEQCVSGGRALEQDVRAARERGTRARTGVQAARNPGGEREKE